ncbi:hypothetical protein SPD48_19125 [Pseudogracilibacillus sp. SE30717A]|uniref:hypothetical protein n=1 Tax=Pseudogracilibacillus sp. SE30717A TaxID=3098293 RepID=UPI00300DCEAF
MEKSKKNRLLKRALFITVVLLLIWSPISSSSLIHTDKVHAETAEYSNIITNNSEGKSEDSTPFSVMENMPEVDKSELQSLLDEIRAEKLNQEDYTQESWNRFILAIEQAESALKDDEISQFQIDIAVINLNLARNGLLIPIPPIEILPIVDKAELQQYVNQMKALNHTLYTKDSWSRLELVIKEAEEVLADKRATQLQIQLAYVKINRAYNGLEKLDGTLPIIGDKSELEAFLKEIYEENLNKEDYTEESWSSFSKAMNTAELVIAYEYATQDQVNRALAQLKKAYEGLVENFPIRPPVEPIVDKSELEELIDHIYAEDLDADQYTTDSWEAFQEAFSKAEEVYSKITASQGEVDTALEDLQTAYDNLELAEDEEDPIDLTPKDQEKPTPEAPKTDPKEPLAEIDISKLETYVNELKDKKLDENLYTEDSWKSFQNALANAENILETDEATQDDVDTALAHLKEAYESLELMKEEDVKGEEEDPESGASGTGSGDSGDGDDKKGGNLPKTATNSWNYVFAGIISVILGFGVHAAYRFRKVI